MKPRVLITGSSSGIGRSTAELLAREGFEVFPTMRNLSKKGDLQNALEMDVTNQESVDACVRTILESGPIDIVINNAGITVDGFFEDLSQEDVRRLFETNVLGAMNVCRSVLPHMRLARRGHIINIGSIASEWALPAITVYSSTKFAIKGFTEGLRLELLPFGIDVSLVEPCFVNTEMVTVNRNVGAKAGTTESAYNERNAVLEKFYEAYAHRHAIEADEVAAAIHKVIREKPKTLMLGKRENTQRLLKKILPENLWRKLHYKDYPLK